MKPTLLSVFLLPQFISSQGVRQLSLHGPQYPAPTQLPSEPKLNAMAASINTTLNKNGNIFPYNETTFSIGMFSLHSEGLLYQYHHKSSDLAKISSGSLDINADTIYRIGSISKLLTTYITLIREGDSFWSKSVAEVLPELTELSSKSWNSLTPNWAEITFGDLAAHMGSIQRNFGLLDFATKSFAFPSPLYPPLGSTNPLPGIPYMRAFPKLPEDQVPHCGYQPPNLSYVPCSEEEYLKGAASASPMFPNAHTTVYSNEAFSIIAFALSKVTGMDFETLFNRTLVAALDLSGTFYTVPTGREYQGAIPGDPTETGWNSNLGPSGPNGGYFSTVNDMATIGKAILNSTLLPPAQTRRWLKPTSFVAYENQAVGRPWEIYRRSTNGHTVDIYSKGGNWGQYATAFLLIPEYDFGFTVLTAADFNTTALSQLQDSLPASLTDTLLPVLEQIAQEQAVKRFAGTYASSNGSSSITFGVNNFPALKVTEWKSLGLNMTEILQEVGGWSTFDFRLYPNHLNTGNSVGFTSLYYTQAAPSNSSTWYLGDPGWFIVDQDTYGNIPVGQFVFQTDKNGIATAVELRSTRQTLRRV